MLRIGTGICIFVLSFTVCAKEKTEASQERHQQSEKIKKCQVKPEKKCNKKIEFHKNDEISLLMQDSAITPVENKKRIEGYMLTNTTDCGYFESAGFNQCDIILTIDGKRATSQAEIIKLLELFSTTGGNVGIQRAGQGVKILIKKPSM